MYVGTRRRLCRMAKRRHTWIFVQSTRWPISTHLQRMRFEDTAAERTNKQRTTTTKKKNANTNRNYEHRTEILVSFFLDIFRPPSSPALCLSCSPPPPPFLCMAFCVTPLMDIDQRAIEEWTRQRIQADTLCAVFIPPPLLFTQNRDGAAMTPTNGG